MGGGGSENAANKGGVRGVPSQMQKKQQVEFIDEVNKPQRSTSINRNG